MGANVKRSRNASARFLMHCQEKSDPEKNAKLLAEVFIEVFDDVIASRAKMQNG